MPRTCASGWATSSSSKALNEGAGSGGGWGDLEAGWDAERFEAAVDAEPGSEERSQLISALVGKFFGSYDTQAGGHGEAFLSLDKGLSVLSQHAASLGYDGLILFLDELILWLASHAADLKFVHQEGPEAGEAGRGPDARPADPDHQLRRPTAGPERADRRLRPGCRAAELRRRAQALGGPLPQDHAGRPQPAGHRREARSQVQERGGAQRTRCRIRADARRSAKR